MIINNSMNFRTDKRKYRQGAQAPNPESQNFTPKIALQNNYHDIKRPLKQNPHDLSFKGLSSFGLYKRMDKVYSKSEFLEFADKYLGKMGRELLEDITVKNKARTEKLIKIDPNDPDKIIVSKKTIPHLALDGVLYPFKILPGDLLNGTVELLGKVPGLKNWSAEMLQRPLFKNIRQRSKIDSKINSLTGLLTFRDMKLDSAKKSLAKELGKEASALTPEEVAQAEAKLQKSLESNLFQTFLKQFDPKSGNYDTKHERALNRLVSGMPPAIFLANDAYNLSRMMDDDPKAAEKERKTRFKQETSRILTSGYLTLITMGAFQKFINKSKAGIVLTTGITVLVTEMFSRLSNGKHISRLTPEEARKENEQNHAPEAKIKPQQNQNISSTGSATPNVKPKEQQKPLLSFDTLMKASAVILATGYGIKGFKNLPMVQNAALKYFENIKLNDAEKFAKLGIKDVNADNAVKTFESKVLYRPFTDLYKKMTSVPFQVDKAKFDAVIDVLDDYDTKIASMYKKVGHSAIKNINGKEIIDLGSKDRTLLLKFFGKEIDLNVKPFVNFVIAPFKFMWNTVTLPYWMVDEKLLSVFKKSKPKTPTKDIEALAKSFDRICNQALKKNLNKEQFKDYLQVNFLKAFNLDSLSSVSNAELSNLAKTAASVATIWFLMTDNYNMVMLKSNGNDKDGANTKFKERFVQEGSRLFYQTLLIDLFNSTFRNQYNSSLMGMSLVTLADTTLGEMLTRKSVGTALKAHTRDELIDMETKQNNSTGFKKKYYNFMQRLTGKRSIKSYEVDSKNNLTQTANTNIPTITGNKDIIFKDDKEVFSDFTAKL